MKILFFGDSLTRGVVGASYLKLLGKRFPNAKLFNRGTNGDTLTVIADKLLKHLQQNSDYDFVVLQGGGNDLLLPLFRERGGLFGFACQSQVKKGITPLLSPSDYYAGVKKLFQQVKQFYRGPIIFVTMSCLNEQLNTAINQQRRVFNAAARKAAEEEGARVADIEPHFENYLSGRQQRHYLIESFWAVTIFDRMICKFRNGPAYLSKRRGLHLTIDGAHPNDTGASIVSDIVAQAIVNVNLQNSTLADIDDLQPQAARMNS